MLCGEFADDHPVSDGVPLALIFRSSNKWVELMRDNSVAGVTEFLRQRVSERTKVPVSEIGGATNLVDIGLESVDAVLICGEIEDEYQIEVEPSLMFEFETLGEVVATVMASFDAQ